MADTENSITTEGIPEIELDVDIMSTVPAPVDATLTIAGQAADAKATGDAIDDLREELTAAITALVPVGTVICNTSTTPPTFGGTWVEIVIPATWGDLEDGNRTYVDGTGTGNLHYWRRTA